MECDAAIRSSVAYDLFNLKLTHADYDTPLSQRDSNKRAACASRI